MSGWIKLHRKLTEWEWYSDVNTTRVFLHLLLVANHKDNQWRGIHIKRGQRLTSLSKLATETNLSVKNIRTAIKRLKSTSEVASYSNAQHTVFTVVNYDLYQDTASEVANEGQANGKQVATNKNEKNEKNEKNKHISDSRFDEFYDLYDKKVGGKKVKVKFDSLSKKAIDKIFEVVEDYVLSTPEKQYRKAPLVWLNGEHWNDEIQKTFTFDCGIDFDAIATNFNKSMSIWEHVPEVVKVTDKQKSLIAILVKDHGMTNERFGKYFEYCATGGKHDGVLNNIKFPAQGLTYFLSEDTIQK